MRFSRLAQVVRGAALYPARLERLSSPPAQLWVDGALPPIGAADRPVVAIVGARAASAEGRRRAHELGAALGRAGVAVISGGAFGIDAAAHEGAMAAGAPTFAVLGCGTDVVYPDRHDELFARIAGAGGLVSEYAPGTKPRPGQFPARNRIIAALCDAVVVVEAAARSGALSTARWARDLQIPLAAYPGSAGTDGLIARGTAAAVAGDAEVFDVVAGRKTPERAPGPLFAQAWATGIRGWRAARLGCCGGCWR